MAASMGSVRKLLRDPVLIVVVAAAALYAAVANPYYLFLLTVGALTVIVGVGLNVLIGLTGQVSFGHVGFYALGAYATAILTTKLGWSFWWTLPVAAVITGAIGSLLGLVALRVSGPYLAMVTIAFGFVVEYSVCPGRGCWTDTDVTNATSPLFCLSIWGRTALVATIGPSRFVSNSRRRFGRVFWRRNALSPNPALLISTSTPPAS